MIDSTILYSKNTVCYRHNSYLLGQQMFWKQRFLELLKESRNYPTL